jgi:photosystem II stability/assembly factor-like uncharacterized protein
MTKTKYILAIFFLTAVFSGCSLLPASPNATNSGEQTFAMTPSIFKSTDGGKTWEIKNQGIGAANTKEIDVLTFAINPSDSSNIYAGLRSGGILETKDAGDSWRFINYQSAKVYGLGLSHPEGETLFASGVWEGRGKMFLTRNEGQEWKEMYTSASDGPLIISLTLDRKNTNVLYATTSDNQAIKSVDGGVSWENIYASDAPILKISIDAGNSDLLYFLTNAGTVFRSRDAGVTLEKISDKIGRSLTGFGGNQFSVLRADPTVSNRVYLAGSGGIVVSDDAGETWRKIFILNDPQAFPVGALAINPKNPREIVYGAIQAVYKSVDGGTNWVTSQFDNEMKINVLEYDPINSDVIYAGFTK